MELKRNEYLVLKHLVKRGVTEEMAPFSMRQHGDVTIEKRRVKMVEEMVPFKIKTQLSFQRWMKRLQEKGLIEVDYTNKFQPKVALTKAGKESL